MIGLEEVEFYVPSVRPSIYELQEQLGLSSSEMEQLTEYHKLHHIAVEKYLSVHEMLEIAAKNLFSQCRVSTEEIGLILFTHSIPQICPFLFDPISRIKETYGLENVPSFSIGQLNCASLDYLLFVCKQWLLARKDMKGILFFSADKMFTQSFRYLKNSSVMGDAAVAGWVKKNATRNFILSSGIDVHATIYDGEASKEEEFNWFQRTFTMGLVKTFRQTLKKQNVPLDQLRYIFPSNVNTSTWGKVSRMLKLPAERFYFPTLSQVGHAHNADALLNYSHAVEYGMLKKGDFFATLTVGMGSTFGCTLFQH
ncbi:3-oxoacyl-[acyl-carrier-protein] synthase III C-terminal domain-containing protein [Bacillus subtilis]|uniref:3-oxoacyl-[acyl-carrier-protein] synthase III C-terminal domain-containing protein n=1 Tax=Bacillus subtilis TaxID=1423 RepID=UPI0022E0EA2E|nr:3-oxoacyl-[acyl-carrier-protein] synthase III C-terminal domain-containing protein [Bacillus subtilis]